jgi:RNA polymerase sigma factor (TIGR02999 family)
MSAEQISHLLADWSRGDETAIDKLMPLVYEELRRLAHRQMRGERSGHTLQTTALVHEAYMKLAHCLERWNGRQHFFAVAARVMRNVLTDHARSINREKRGGGAVKVQIDEASLISDDRAVDILALDEAMTRLEAQDERKCRVVELRIFLGSQNSEIARLLGISTNQVIRDWNFARAWLRREITR